MRQRSTQFLHLAFAFLFVQSVVIVGNAGAADDGPDYSEQIAPLLAKYCVGCHGSDDPDGKLSLETYADIQKGGTHGAALLPGEGESSRLIRVLTGAAKPKMPPEGEPVPTAAEIAVLTAWINAGAMGPNGAEPDRMQLAVPKLAPNKEQEPILSVELNSAGTLAAVAKYGRVELIPVAVDPQSAQLTLQQDNARTLGPFPGKVTSVHFVETGVDGEKSQIVTASGVAGLGGVAALWDAETGDLVREFKGHRDILFDAEVSPDGKLLATCGYDKVILLWDIATGQQVRALNGHNGAVYDVAFHPTGEFLVSASADDTAKVWRVADGERMDTLGQPLKEEYCITFSPDGKQIVAGGADNNIRVWKFISTDRPRINPMIFARFAHEGAVLGLQFTRDGQRLVSIAEDKVLKVWETRQFTEVANEQQPSFAAALTVGAGDRAIVIGSMTGELRTYPLSTSPVKPSTDNHGGGTVAVAVPPMPSDPMQKVSEAEPNNTPQAANAITLPAQITGVIDQPANAASQGEQAPAVGEANVDADLYRFHAKQGEEWVFEVNASRSKSPLDSYLDVLDGAGNRIVRTKLQAVKESYFTFRGKDANQTGDFRVFNWEEMELNEFLYANGEVVKLWLYPRGPDSGFETYPGSGNRWGYFDTTSLSHALGEPAYIVTPHKPDESIIPNGLPVFPIYYENDDESHRELGSDSKLYFTAPADGEFIVRIRDVRGFEGADYKYTLNIRPRQPDFTVTLQGGDKTINAGSGKEFKVSVRRIDDYTGPIRVDITDLPPGFDVTTPIIVEEGQIAAHGTITAANDALAPTPENEAISKATATAMIRGKEVTREIGGLGKIIRADAPKILVEVVPDERGAKPIAMPEDGPLEFEIHPGETIMLRLKLTRNEFNNEVSFGKEGAGRNLPFGVYVDNIGLNGLLLLTGQTEREFFITAAPWVEEQSRLFHINTGSEGGQTSQPVLLHVRGK